MRSISLRLIISAISISFLSLQTSAAPYRMKTQLDADLQIIVDTLGGALLKRIPSLAKDSSFVLSSESRLEEGKITADYVANFLKAETEVLLSSPGRINIQLAEISGQKSAVEFSVVGELQIEDLLNLFAALNETLCGLKGEASCSLPTVIEASDSILKQTEQVRVSAERLRANVRLFLAAASATEPERKSISFGGSTPAPKSTTSIISGELSASLNSALDAVKITSDADRTEISLDMNQFKEIDADWNKINPMLSFLFSFKSVSIAIDEQRTVYNLSSGFEIPAQVITSYDGYLSEQQATANGLKPLSALVEKMGVWAVGRCSNEQYQALCIDKLLNGCTKDTGRVGSCLSEAESIQAARESSANGDHLGAAAKGAEIFGKEVLHSVDDGVAGFFSWVTGNDQKTESDEDPDEE